MKKFLMIGLLAALVASSLGCTNMSKTQQGVASGAALGALGGAGVAAIAGGSAGWGALTGAGVGGAGRRHHRPRAKQEQKLVKLCQLRAGLPRPYRAARKRGGLFCSRHSALAVPDFIGAARPCGHTCCNSRQILRHCARSPTPPTLASGVRSGVPTGVLRVGGACPTIFFGP